MDNLSTVDKLAGLNVSFIKRVPTCVKTLSPHAFSSNTQKLDGNRVEMCINTVRQSTTERYNPGRMYCT